MQEDRRSNVGGYTRSDAPAAPAAPPSEQELQLRAKSMRGRESLDPDGRDRLPEDQDAGSRQEP